MAVKELGLSRRVLRLNKCILLTFHAGTKGGFLEGDKDSTVGHYSFTRASLAKQSTMTKKCKLFPISTLPSSDQNNQTIQKGSQIGESY